MTDRDEPVLVDRALLAAWRLHPGHIVETRAVVADWLAAIVATPVEAAPTGPWLAGRLTHVLGELDAFSAAVDRVRSWQADAVLDALDFEPGAVEGNE